MALGKGYGEKLYLNCGNELWERTLGSNSKSNSKKETWKDYLINVLSKMAVEVIFGTMEED